MKHCLSATKSERAYVIVSKNSPMLTKNNPMVMEATSFAGTFTLLVKGSLLA
jgi:hypothetical protein